MTKIMEPKTYFFMFPSKHGGTVTTTTIALLEDESKTNDFKTTRYIMRAQTQKNKANNELPSSMQTTQ